MGARRQAVRTTSRRMLIVNADDFGMSVGINRGIVDAFRFGILTSTSLMVNRPAARDAALRARHLDGLSVGLHLELDGTPTADLRLAVSEQVQRFHELLGRTPTHIDSHHDRHCDADALPYVLDVATRLGAPLRRHSPIRCHTSFYGQWGGVPHLEQVSVECLVGMLRTEVGTGITELICHPGYVDGEVTSSYAREREAELTTLRDPRIRDALKREGIQLTGFREFPKLFPSHTSDGRVGS